ncbi:hypothetical protein MHZ92_01070 [Sporosarcina sp. ACRSL]|uniref:hypothetical protein n=1 Tax=Sporosarcina sp. ACRSL TaxID=2918215 RepID=UPI001EF50DB9|nr:hypothetical protein [Sporosarcina sp. ACRSL]MCG7342700.1 hypothetical protein [Sporosarcina sp. ACRSL]
MAIWIIPLLIVFAIIGFIAWKAVRKWDMVAATTFDEKDHAIPRAVEKHPFTLNPIIWVIGVASIFILFVIFYYWASSI